MQIRDALSARLDGEDPGIDEVTVYQHLAACPECRDFARDSEALHRVVRLEPAPAMPDLAPGILAAIGADTGTDRLARRWSPAAVGSPAPASIDAGSTETAGILRWVLVAIAMAQIAVAVPALLGSDAGLPVHTARHIGSFDIALAVGFLFVAWRPSRIPGLLPVVAALVVCLVVSAVLDVGAGNTAAFGEGQHVTDLAGLLVMWLIGREVTRPVALA